MEGFEERWERLREKDRSFNERMERIRKKQQESDVRWELLLEEQQRLNREQKNSLEGLLKSISNLGQLILERRRVSNVSHIATQLFEVKPENKEKETFQPTSQLFDEKTAPKLELADFKSQGKTVEIVEQLHHQKQTATLEVLELQTEKENPENTSSYFLEVVKPENQFELKPHQPEDVCKQAKLQDAPLKDVIEAPKPDPTFRSPLAPKQWPQTNNSFNKTFPEFVPTPSTCAQNTQTTQNKPELLPETILPGCLFFGTCQIGPPFPCNHVAIICSSFSRSTTLELDEGVIIDTKRPYYEQEKHLKKGIIESYNSEHDAITIFLLSITWTVSVPEPFQVH